MSVDLMPKKNTIAKCHGIYDLHYFCSRFDELQEDPQANIHFGAPAGLVGLRNDGLPVNTNTVLPLA